MPILNIAIWFGIFVHESLLEKFEIFENVAQGLNLMTAVVIMKH